jgi:hypothetical protein
MDHPVAAILLCVVIPLWFTAGIADWLCHRASMIERTSGVRESLLHLLQFAEVGAALIVVLLCELNALAFAILLAALALHEATAIWDVRYAVRRRRVVPVEQHVHAVLEILPLTAILLLASAHWPQFLALFGLGAEPARFELAWKSPPMPPALVAGILLAAFVLAFLPFAEELRRGIRAARARRGDAERAGLELTPAPRGQAAAFTAPRATPEIRRNIPRRRYGAR